jgi:signal transduction histidine kinase
MRSLQTRLSTTLGLALALLLALLLAVGGYSLRRLAEEFVASRLEHDAEALLAALSFDPQGRPWLQTGRFNPVFQQPYSGHYYKLRVGDQELRSRSLWDSDLPLPPTRQDTFSRQFVTGPQQRRLLVLARTFQVAGRQVVLAVTEDFTPLNDGLWRLTGAVVLLAVGLFSVLLLLQRRLVRRALQPLEQIRQDILRLAHGDIRQLQTTVPDEVRPLVVEINHLITVMAQRLQRSRHALGNLAHALKTPLTVLTQLAAHPQVEAQAGLCGELTGQTRQIRQLVDRELRRARIAGAATPGQRVMLAGEVTDLVATLRKIHRDKPLTIECRIPAATPFPGDRDDLLELLGNLLDNACQWATGRVRLTVQERDGWQALTVEDDGPGCPPEQLARLTGRGVRIDELQAGHGLGLAIVGAMVEQYGGRLHFDRSADLGGFAVRVELPCR